MRRLLLPALAITFCLLGCKQQFEGPKVMARAVPERSDDFVFENNLIAGRFYGKALEGNPTSPGVDIWVKMPGKLVADTWYAAAQTQPEYYHHNHGDGKDCYKVSVSLGGGASAAMIDGKIQYPASNYRSFDVLTDAEDSVVFVLHYPAWQADGGVTISLDKRVTVTADTYFCKVEDTYKFSSDTMQVAAGVFRHPSQDTIEEELKLDDRYAIWEHASDQSIETEDGMLGVAVFVPGAQEVKVSDDQMHGLCIRTIKSGEPFTYYFGSCWSKGDIKTSADWFDLVKKLK